jgi:hypothetical protein
MWASDRQGGAIVGHRNLPAGAELGVDRQLDPSTRAGNPGSMMPETRTRPAGISAPPAGSRIVAAGAAWSKRTRTIVSGEAPVPAVNPSRCVPSGRSSDGSSTQPPVAGSLVSRLPVATWSTAASTLASRHRTTRVGSTFWQSTSVARDRVRDPRLVQGRADPMLRLVRDPQHRPAAPAVAAMGRVERGHDRAAGSVPSRPEVDRHPAGREGAPRDGVAAREPRGGDVRRSLSPAQRGPPRMPTSVGAAVAVEANDTKQRVRAVG